MRRQRWCTGRQGEGLCSNMYAYMNEQVEDSFHLDSIGFE
jgi:hypothetical protein